MASKCRSKFQCPAEWNDEDRMYFLLAPFPPTDEPPISDSKFAFWRTLIVSSSRDLGECVFTKRQLCERLKWHDMQPKCLNEVIKVMEKMGDIKKVSNYENNTGWIGWGVSVVSSPLKWAWRNYVSAPVDNDEEEYVIVSYVKELANAVFAAHVKTVAHATTDCVYTCSDFSERCQGVMGDVSQSSCRVVELELMKEGLAVKGVSKDNESVILKLAASRNQKAAPIDETDFGIISLKSILLKLQGQILEKTNCRERLKNKCIELVKDKQKSRAIRFLRMSKSIESQIVRLDEHYSNLQAVLNQIEMAETNAQVLRAYESGSSALKGIREDHGLTVDRVDKVMDEVQQLLEDGEEINNSMAIDKDDGITDEELLMELGSLLDQSEDVSAVDSNTNDVIVKLKALNIDEAQENLTFTEEEKEELEEKKTPKKKVKPTILSA